MKINQNFPTDIEIKTEGEKNVIGNDRVTLLEKSSCSIETQSQKEVSFEIEAKVEEVVEVPFIKLATMETEPITEV